MISEVTCEDNMIMMARYPDKFFDLAIVDPPYGIGGHKRIGKRREISDWIGSNWDNNVPDDKYFKELFRVSKDQIIFGGNYFNLPPTRCMIIWDKMQRIDQADAEIAWTSFKSSVRIFQFHSSRLIGFMNKERFHPTEKPIDLYRWILKKYAAKGDKILDTHLGSQSSRIAAHIEGFDFYGCELDKEYFDAGCKRFNEHIKQQILFT